jgi:hypothetical protein
MYCILYVRRYEISRQVVVASVMMPSRRISDRTRTRAHLVGQKRLRPLGELVGATHVRESTAILYEVNWLPTAKPLFYMKSPGTKAI